MADLRERLRSGEVAALLDPALPLHLLAEPEADWWLDGAAGCARRLIVQCYDAVEAYTPALRVFERWAHRTLDLAGVSRDSYTRGAVDSYLWANDRRLPDVPQHVISTALSRTKCPRLVLARLVPLAHGLHALVLARVPADVGAALEVLAKYAG